MLARSRHCNSGHGLGVFAKVDPFKKAGDFATKIVIQHGFFERSHQSTFKPARSVIYQIGPCKQRHDQAPCGFLLALSVG